jgi:hypothetical protein
MEITIQRIALRDAVAASSPIILRLGRNEVLIYNYLAFPYAR